ncbi:MAG: L-asparaginase [Peptococcaceae bacterium]|nr:L-asparaginase [Peptococcaceae bacterium]
MLGYVYPDRIVFNRTRERRILELSSLKDYSVEIIKFYAGADEKFFLAAIEQGVKGLIVEGVGLGNVNEPFYRGIRKAREKGLEVVITSRCSYGRVVPKYGYPGGGLSLENLGVIFGGHLSSPKARLLLMMGLSKELAHEELQDLFVYFTI